MPLEAERRPVGAREALDRDPPGRHLGIAEAEQVAKDKADLVAFMKEGLMGDLPKVETGRLPKGGEQAQEEEHSIEEVKETLQTHGLSLRGDE